jgi:hypothetical protein
LLLLLLLLLLSFVRQFSQLFVTLKFVGIPVESAFAAAAAAAAVA